MNTHAQSYWQRRFAVDKNLLEEQRELADYGNVDFWLSVWRLYLRKIF